jgi:hypothetical protein
VASTKRPRGVFWSCVPWRAACRHAGSRVSAAASTQFSPASGAKADRHVNRANEVADRFGVRGQASKRVGVRDHRMAGSEQRVDDAVPAGRLSEHPMKPVPPITTIFISSPFVCRIPCRRVVPTGFCCLGSRVAARLRRRIRRHASLERPRRIRLRRITCFVSWRSVRRPRPVRPPSHLSPAQQLSILENAWSSPSPGRPGAAQW